ncbi:MAG: VanW family protein [Eubacteriales bacterium]|nr:VanW family protein [Eubacteriales bacterium]
MRIKRKAAVGMTMAFLGMSSLTAFAEDTIGSGISIEGISVEGMTFEEAQQAVKSKVQEMLNSTIEVQVGEDQITATAVDFGLQWKNRDVVQEAMKLGNSGNLIKRYKDERDLQRAPKEISLEFSANEEDVKAFIEGNCLQFEREAHEASITSDGAGGINMIPGESGQSVNVSASVDAVMNYISENWQGGGSVELAVQVEAPRGSAEDLETITDLLGTYTTYYGSTEGRNINVERGAELINGYIVWPGDSFSVCDHLVPFNAENGYELAGAYEEGRVVQEYGGGICQVSTTLYNALLRAEIEIDERHNHTMSVSYVPTSMDAAIAEGVMDLIFTNNKETPIFISGYAYGGELTFSVWGKETRPEDRYIDFYSETLSTIEAPSTVQLYARDDQPVGYFSQVQYAAAGSTAAMYKTVSYNGEMTTEQINTSTYNATASSYEVGTSGASQSLLNAVYSNDLASAQLAATGTAPAGTGTTTETNASADGENTGTSENTGTGENVSGENNGENGAADGTQTQQENTASYETDAAGGYYMDTDFGEVYVPGDAGENTNDSY